MGCGSRTRREREKKSIIENIEQFSDSEDNVNTVDKVEHADVINCHTN